MGDPFVVVVMGVSGSGKTTVGALLAGRLGWPYAEADDFHPPENIAKMAAGHPLNDEDRWPWLRKIAAWIRRRLEAGEGGVVSCSALKRSYRDLLRGERPGVRVVYLQGDRDVILQRMTARHGHFMKAAMLDSQFADLEEPTADEGVITVSTSGRPKDTVEEILERL